MIGGAFRRNVMQRAYKGGYGGVIPPYVQEERKLMRGWVVGSFGFSGRLNA